MLDLWTIFFLYRLLYVGSNCLSSSCVCMYWCMRRMGVRGLLVICIIEGIGLVLWVLCFWWCYR